MASTLKQKVFRAGGWNIAGYAMSQVMRLGNNLVMTRLLAPEMFGVMAIATTVTTVLALLSDIGVRQNIVQSHRGDDPAFLDTAWVVQIVRGAILWFAALGICVALYFANHLQAFPADSVYAISSLPFVIVACSFSAVISGFQSTKWATAYRKFDQKRITQIELAAQLVALIFMIPAALSSRSIWVLVIGWLVASLVRTILSHTWMNGHSNRIRWDKDSLKELIQFGKWVFVSSFVGVLASSGDFILGGFVEAEVLGLYVIAGLLIGAIPGGLGRLFAMVLMPALSEISRKDPARMREIYYRMRVPSDLVFLFVMGILFTAGQVLVDVLYDPRYGRAGEFLEILSLGLFFGRYGISHQVYLAVGLPKNLAILNIVNLVSLYTIVPFLYFFGGVSLAIWGLALHPVTSLPFIYYFNAKLNLNDFRLEFLVLAAVPAGLLFGWALNLLWKWAIGH